MVIKAVLSSASLLIVSLTRKVHTLAILLTLESFVILTLIAILTVRDLFFSVVYLRVGACEAAVGLSCIVGLVRIRGKEYINLGEYGSYIPPTSRFP